MASWTRWWVLLGVWLTYMSFGLVATSMAPLVGEIERDLALSHAAMGGVMGAWQLVYIGAAIPCGMLLDRLGSRWALLLGALFVAASVFGRSLAQDFNGLLLAVMLFGVGGPIVSAGAPKVIATWFSGPSRGFAMGIYITGPAIGGVVSLTLSQAWLIPLFDNDWRAILRLWALFAVGAGVAWWCIASLPAVRPLTDRIHTEASASHGQVIRGLLGETSVRLMLVMSVGVFLMGHGFSNWLPALLIADGMQPTEAGYWAALPTLVGILGALTIPRLATPQRRFKVLIGLSSALFLATVLLQFQQPVVLSLGLILQGIARSTLMTVLILTLVELPGIGERHAGTAAGLFFAAAEFGGMLGPLLLGVLYDWTHGFGVGLALFSLISGGLIVGVRRLQQLTRSE